MIDVLAFAPHPDDVELYCAATLVKLKQQGYTTAIIDLTRGEMSSRGTPESRERETLAASHILKLDHRENLSIPDNGIQNDDVNRRKVIEILRRLRPNTVLIPYFIDRHPDHEHASALIKEAIFYSGLSKIEMHDANNVPLPAYRPKKSFYYMLERTFEPSFIVDVTETFEQRLEAIRTFATQFNSTNEQDGPKTFISSPDFFEFIIARARSLGFSIGVRYGEGFLSMTPTEMPIQGLVT